MFNSLFASLPNGFRQVVSFCVTVLCAYVFLWILTWLLHWTAKYGFLPMP